MLGAVLKRVSGLRRHGLRRHGLWGKAPVLAALALAGCPGQSGMDQAPAPAIVLLKSVGPATILPNTRIRVEGENLAGPSEHFLMLSGTVPGRSRLEQVIPLELTEDQPGSGSCVIDAQLFSVVGEGLFDGSAQVVSRNEWSEVRGPALKLSLQFVRHLTPTAGAVGNGVVFLNSAVPVEGGNLLAGGSEGKAVAELSGCFTPKGGTAACATPNVQASMPIELEGGSRARGSFLFEPAVAGVKPGRFEGTLTLVNQHPDGTVLRSQPIPAQLSLEATHMTGFEQSAVSLGQVLRIQGKGFIDGSSLRFDGTFTDQLGQSRPAKFELVLDTERGGIGRAVIDENGGIGSVVQLRGTKPAGGPWVAGESGMLNGSWTPVTRYGSQQELGESVSLSLGVAPLKQVIWVRFTEAWYDALKSFGLQAADLQIRQHVIDIFHRDYAGTNVEARLEEPKDYKLYGRLDVVARNPNNGVGVGLDATPGKDQYNQRLTDVVGGYQAETSTQKLAPFGGVFAEAMLSMSLHPPTGVWAWKSLQTPLFDEIFDPVRPDTGQPISSTEAQASTAFPGTSACPAAGRAMQVACAIQVLGNLIGGTAVHEFGHTLGLAKPDVANVRDCHNSGDRPNRIMDGGDGRPFVERAVLQGAGPAMFCAENYAYLKTILPSSQPAPPGVRPPCF